MIRRIVAVLSAALAAAVVWAVAVPIAGVDLTASTGQQNQEIGVLAVVVVALLVGLAGWALLAILERTTTRARTVWTIVAAVVLLLSLLGPTSATSVAAGGVLAALHVVTGVVLILTLARTAAPRARTSAVGDPA